MILDNKTLLSDKQAIVATGPSTDVLDFGANGVTYNGIALKQRAGLEPIPFLIQVVEDFNNLTTLNICIEIDDDSAFGSLKKVAEVTVALADLKAGAQFPFEILPKNIDKRYLRVCYTVVGAAPTVGRVTAGVTVGVDGAYKG